MKYVLIWLLSINLVFADELSELKNKAEAGDLSAQLDLGHRYAKGTDIDQDYNEAAKWYELAAAQDDPEAQTELATLYDSFYEKYNRSIVPLGSNNQKARALYEKAAEKKYAKAQALLGTQYLYNGHSKEEKQKSIALFRFAANKGDATAIRELAHLYSSGHDLLGIQKNEQTAYKLDSLAAKKGDPLSQGNLAYYLFQEKNYSEAKRWAEESAYNAAYSAMGPYVLGLVYSDEDSEYKNDSQAKKWFGKACDLGDDRACASLKILNIEII